MPTADPIRMVNGQDFMGNVCGASNLESLYGANMVTPHCSGLLSNAGGKLRPFPLARDISSFRSASAVDNRLLIVFFFFLGNLRTSVSYLSFDALR